MQCALEGDATAWFLFADVTLLVESWSDVFFILEETWLVGSIA